MPYEGEHKPRLIEVSPKVAEVLDRLSHLLGVSHTDIINEAMLGNSFEDATNGDVGSFIEIGNWFELPAAELKDVARRATEYYETPLAVYCIEDVTTESGLEPPYVIDRAANPIYPAIHGTRIA